MKTRSTMRTYAALALAIVASGCSLDAASRGPFGPEDPETVISKKPLPAQIPARHILEFTADESVGHIKPKMAGAVAEATVTRSTNQATLLTEQEVAALRKSVENDPKASALLGARWGFINASRLPPEGKVSFGCCRNQAQFAKLTYYSYSNNVAVEVRLKGMMVMSASHIAGYLPPEGPEEIQRGIELARADQRIGDKVQGLQGHGLLMQPDRGFFRNDPGYGHRVLWVTFSEGLDGDPKFWAKVDLTEDRVLESGDEPPR
jgi:hypothetical protein